MLWPKFWLVSPKIWVNLDLCWSPLTRSFRILPCPCWVTCLGPTVCKAPWVRSRIMVAHKRLWLSSFQICKFILHTIDLLFSFSKADLASAWRTPAGWAQSVGKFWRVCSSSLQHSAKTDVSKQWHQQEGHQWFRYSVANWPQWRQVSVFFNIICRGGKLQRVSMTDDDFFSF